MSRSIILTSIFILAGGYVNSADMSATPAPAAKPSGTVTTTSAPATPALPGIQITPETTQWQDAPPILPAGAKMALLEGNPGANTYFAIRLQLPAGYKVPPHLHATGERTTIISGALFFGFGKKWDDKALREYKAGAYLSTPPNTRHFAMTKEPTVIQIASLGPWGLEYVNPKDNPLNKKK